MNQNSNLKELNLCVLENSRANLIKSFFFFKSWSRERGKDNEREMKRTDKDKKMNF